MKASFRPDDEMCRIRAIQRHRETLVHEASRHIQPMQKALDRMNRKLSKVLTDITGVSGMRIIEHILKGERNPKLLSTFRDHRCTCSEEEIANALTGDDREEHLFVLRQALEGYQCVHKQIQHCGREIEARLKAIEKHVDAHHTPPPVRVKSGASRTSKKM
ncbi:MAG: Hsp33 family molecular chaperone HslO [bacterium]|nr:Hsp33 family molecular chaperone HslO [bacterium]